MATEPKTTDLTYTQLLEMFPQEDNIRRELIDGELIVTASPIPRHQEVVLRLGAHLLAWVYEEGGRVFVAPLDVYFDERNVVEPDVLFIRAEHLDRIDEKNIKGPPDLVVEVSSPSTRRLELVRKRELYERFEAKEYWYVDRDADRVEIYRLERGRYGPPRYLSRGETLESPEIPGFTIPVDDLLGPPPEE